MPFFDTSLLGTPVQLLQIPASVQQAIISSMQRASCTQHMFTQDGKRFDELSSSVTSPSDLECARAKDLQVCAHFRIPDQLLLHRSAGRVVNVWPCSKTPPATINTNKCCVTRSDTRSPLFRHTMNVCDARIKLPRRTNDSARRRNSRRTVQRLNISANTDDESGINLAHAVVYRIVRFVTHIPLRTFPSTHKLAYTFSSYFHPLVAQSHTYVRSHVCFMSVHTAETMRKNQSVGVCIS
jgi:hypothetical protein